MKTILLVIMISILGCTNGKINNPGNTLPPECPVDEREIDRTSISPDTSTKFVEDEIIIKIKNTIILEHLKREVTIAKIDQVYKKLILNAKDKKIREAIRKRGLDKIYLLKVKPENREGLLAKYYKHQYVEYIQRNYIYEPEYKPNDTRYKEQYSHAITKAEEAWEDETGSPDVVVAIIGVGVDMDHIDLKDNIWTNEDEDPETEEKDDDANGYENDFHGYDFWDDDNDPRPKGDNINASHETLAAGVACAEADNGHGIAGVSWVSKIMPLRVIKDSTQVAMAIDYAAMNGADIISMSFGNYTPEKFGEGMVKEAIDAAYEAGVLLVASGGRDTVDTLRYPGALYNVLAVGGTNSKDNPAGFSNYGPWLDISAPGKNILSTVNNNDYDFVDGTSFAVPYISGTAALILSKKPSLSNIELRALLENSVDDISKTTEYIRYGSGRINVKKGIDHVNIKFPLGEIIGPKNKMRFSESDPDIDISWLAHGNEYQFYYSQFGRDIYKLVENGDTSLGPNIFSTTIDNPGLGTYLLRLKVKSSIYESKDYKVFGIDGGYLEPWSGAIPGTKNIRNYCI